MSTTIEKPARIYHPGQFEAHNIPEGEYRDLVVRLCRETGEMASNPEYIKQVKKLVGFVDLGPTAADRVRIAAYYADEMRHGYIFEGLLHELDEDTTDPTQYSSIEALNLLGDIDTWESLAVYNTLMDRAGGMCLLDYETSSYAPLARAGMFVGRDERGHAAMGQQHLEAACKSEEGRRIAQEALEHWWPVAMAMFGRSESKRQWRYLELGLKTKTNDEMRQAFIDEITPLLERAGLEVPAWTP